MKYILASILCVFWVSDASGQSRTSGQIVVPYGWENEDSVRNSAFDQGGYWDTPALDDLLDTFQINHRHDWGGFDPNIPLPNKRRSVTARGDMPCVPVSLNDIGQHLKQRTFYPAPIALGYRFGPGQYWRYNAANFDEGAEWHNDRFFSNSITPYALYPKNSDVVTENYVTRRMNIVTGLPVDSTLKYGIEGKMILGYSVDRMAEPILKYSDNYPLPLNWKDTLVWKYKNSGDGCFNYRVLSNPGGLTLPQLLDSS